MNLLQIALALFILACTAQAQEFAKATYITDGDTLWLEDGTKVRLTGIDTPEFHSRPGHRADRKRAQEAKNELARLVLGKKVRLEADEEPIDDYDRHLYYIWIDNVLINEVLVERGFAKAYPFKRNVRYKEVFARAEAKAKKAKIGIWNPERRS